MLDFGWPELLLILAVAVFVTGSDDIPKLLYNAGRVVRRLQYLRFAMSSQFESFMREHDLAELRTDRSSVPDDYDDTGEDEFVEIPEDREGDDDQKR
ncbi:MAG: hypothetical protein EOM26_04940 [Alphaproteobacteria bacterium]|nr:hypothetical protein [Alphaproteobacteria bacterium]